MDIHEVMKYLPHRYPFLLVDRVLEMTDEKIIALKNVTINEPFFVGHFPHSPVMPGVLIIEAMAQTAAIMSFKSKGVKPDDNTILYFAGIDNARFKRPVLPGDTLIFEATLVREMRGIWKYAAVARVGDEVAVQAELMCAIKKIA
ncbi:MAG: 3-hydroxyacyl-[acyl-carrier-protein] dehydratase FabZ [Candidatus Dactylopiibacterium carminicum]|uniref:3-hydroxyacyl-[acyl-carrier-protein] dehydratase FabZ n=1 Tax=Candidatus Dactylopiibacterium carminicum TaxID=857335 RepID=A0A272EQE5_9RHOO|nr:3-hydroxyacyl-ACP dehydratase FabZ [Candidatus Dactylopiibacterium carminicum]KAF7598551.1 3-hydroxyacyl-[acyl-carrier-protein] dehydratase FabZ [Candidatus Dactylopiibacterium carminicum]PAS92318.1 MAG: 3-hydroxyacyl-[acyl-carrier-protein] dehydratase FabZ [Candidatus Dactylopiibacterium carminicum]PAS95903.1 MAG: 3-hydroxyacyl-[acyl-carrier-protein] dehydratase FabZ [Candidatus Dactylopiibacterium carminicum]PAS98111.1 MAG: 3-hydroxyacyl-[acyl-carrier-protein] dehydratase FabZ [Candidatus 